MIFENWACKETELEPPEFAYPWENCCYELCWSESILCFAFLQQQCVICKRGGATTTCYATVRAAACHLCTRLNPGGFVSSVLKMGTMSPSVGRLYYVFSVKTVICVSCGTVRGFFVCFCFLTFHPLHFFYINSTVWFRISFGFVVIFFPVKVWTVWINSYTFIFSWILLYTVY